MTACVQASRIGMRSIMVLSFESSITSKRSRFISQSIPLWKRQYSIQVNPSTSSPKSFEKIGISPPPPPRKPNSPGSRSNGIIILTLVAAFAGYYYKDDIMKQFNTINAGNSNNNKNKSDSSTEVSKEVRPSTPSISSSITPSAASALTNMEASMGLAPIPPPTASNNQNNGDPSSSSPMPSSKDANSQKKPVPPAFTKSEVKNLNDPKPGEVDYNAVRQAIVNILDDETYDDGSYGPLFVRLAWHASGTYDKNTGRGGSDGATMRFAGEADWGANAGLHVARGKLEPIKAKFPGLTYADLWILAGSVAIEEMGGPHINFRPGRKDALGTANLPDGLLPDADGRDKKENISDHLRDIFYRQGFNDQEIVALSGAHALGRCHPDRSGYWGPWTRAPTTFSNEYFKLILNEEWNQKKTHQGKPWTGPVQYEDKTGELMMLPTDLALVKDPKMKVWVEKYAKDEKLFFDDFAKAWIKLTENGVRRFYGTRRYYFFGPRE